MNNQFIQRVIFDWNRIDNDSYLKSIEDFKGIEKLDFNKSITFFVGENGSGKSTLLEALAVAHGFNPEGGTKRESFLALAQKHLHPNGLYLFDEPEAALSPQRQLTLLIQIYNCAKEGAQFIIVTHSPILLGIPDADIYCFDNGRIHLCEYEDTESYQITEMFINNRQMLLDRLLTD